MKKGWKVFWIVCLIIAMLGLRLCFAGVALGFNISELDRAFWDDQKYINLKKTTTVTVDQSEPSQYEEHDEDHTVDTKADISDVSHLNSFDYVKKLSIDIGAGQLIIKTYDGDGIRCDFSGLNSQASHEIKQEGSKLKIDVGTKKRVITTLDVGKVILYVPEDLELEDLSLDVGAGDVVIGDIFADVIDMECGAGRIEYTTSRDQDDFNYNIQCGVGTIRIGESEFSGLGTEKKMNNGADYDMDIECGVGEIVVNFI